MEVDIHTFAIEIFCKFREDVLIIYKLMGNIKVIMTRRLIIIFLSVISLRAVSQNDTLQLDYFQEQTILDTGKVIILTTHSYNLSGAMNGNFKGKAIYNFHYGKKNGVAIKYWHSGQKYIEENYKNGKRDGESRMYSFAGVLENYFFYKNDTIITSIWYYLNGIKRSESIKDSNDVSYYYERLENGQLKYSKFIYNDSIVSINYYHNDKIKDKDVLIIKTRIHNAKLWDKKGTLLKEREFIIDGGTLPKEIIYEPEIIKNNDEYRTW